MNPDTGEMKRLQRMLDNAWKQDDGTPVPESWRVFTVGEEVFLDGHRFKVAHINESCLVLEPQGSEE